MRKTIYDVPERVDDAVWLNQGEEMIIVLSTALDQYKSTGILHRVKVTERCSNCFYTTAHDDTIKYDYCPHCGSKMKQAWETNNEVNNTNRP
jgi:rRNA maturation endonuclease Nob1